MLNPGMCFCFSRQLNIISYSIKHNIPITDAFKETVRKATFFLTLFITFFYFSLREFIFPAAFALWNFITVDFLYISIINSRSSSCIHLFQYTCSGEYLTTTNLLSFGIHVQTCLLNPSKQTQTHATLPIHLQIYTGMLSTAYSAVGSTSTTRRK